MCCQSLSQRAVTSESVTTCPKPLLLLFVFKSEYVLETYAESTAGVGKRHHVPVSVIRDSGNPGVAYELLVKQIEDAAVDLEVVIEVIAGEHIQCCIAACCECVVRCFGQDRKSTRLNSSHVAISYAV